MEYFADILIFEYDKIEHVKVGETGVRKVYIGSDSTFILNGNIISAEDIKATAIKYTRAHFTVNGNILVRLELTIK